MCDYAPYIKAFERAEVEVIRLQAELIKVQQDAVDCYDSWQAQQAMPDDGPVDLQERIKNYVENIKKINPDYRRHV